MIVRALAGAVVMSILIGPAPIAAQDLSRAKLQEAVDAFEARDLDDRPVSMRSLRGRAVLLEFWATWCAPCLSDIPVLQKARQAYPDGFEVVGITLDVMDRAAVRSWLRLHGVDWPQVYDGRGWSSPVITPFGFDRLPFNVLVDADGRIIGTDVRGERLLRTLDTLLEAR